MGWKTGKWTKLKTLHDTPWEARPDEILLPEIFCKIFLAQLTNTKFNLKESDMFPSLQMGNHFREFHKII